MEFDLCGIHLLLLMLQLLGPSAQQTLQLLDTQQPAESNAIHDLAAQPLACSLGGRLPF